MPQQLISVGVFLSVLLSVTATAGLAQITFGLPSAPSINASQQKSAITRELEVLGSSKWTDSGIDLRPGEKVVISSEGQVKLLLGGPAGPEGIARTWHDVIRTLPLNSAGPGALIARIGDNNAAVPFLVGNKKEFVATRPGRLFLGVNVAETDSLTGNFKVNLQVLPPEKPLEPVTQLKFDELLFEQIPRRITDKAGGVGDMVNFILIGSSEDMQSSFAAGGWVQVDRTVQDAILNAVVSTTNKSAYLEMPMSELYLFGRPQDYGFARADPVMVVQERHHLRIWKAPFQVNGQDAWIGAATHDIGFEEDQRNGKVTHKIDPNVDLEREFVHASLTEGGGVLSDVYVTPKAPVTEAKTATGGGFHSDGRVLIMQLRPTSPATKTAGN